MSRACWVFKMVAPTWRFIICFLRLVMSRKDGCWSPANMLFRKREKEWFSFVCERIWEYLLLFYTLKNHRKAFQSTNSKRYYIRFGNSRVRRNCLLSLWAYFRYWSILPWRINLLWIHTEPHTVRITRRDRSNTKRTNVYHPLSNYGCTPLRSTAVSLCGFMIELAVWLSGRKTRAITD